MTVAVATMDMGHVDMVPSSPPGNLTYILKKNGQEKYHPVRGRRNPPRNLDFIYW